MLSWISIGLTGLWPLVWKFGFTGILIAACVAGYFFMPAPILKIFPNIQKFLIRAAVILTVSLVSYAVGVADEHNRSVAKDIAWTEQNFAAGQKARADAEAKVKAARSAPKRKPSVWVHAPQRDGYDRASSKR